MWRIDQAPELRKMLSPPLVGLVDRNPIDWSSRQRFVTPPAPIAANCVHAVGHIEARIVKGSTNQTVFLIQLNGDGQ